MAYPLLDDVDRRPVGALQVDGRASPEQLADALDLPARTVARLLAALLRDGTVRVTAVPPRDPGQRTSVVRVTVRRGKADAIAAALARRADGPFVDVASTARRSARSSRRGTARAAGCCPTWPARSRTRSPTSPRRPC